MNAAPATSAGPATPGATASPGAPASSAIDRGRRARRTRRVAVSATLALLAVALFALTLMIGDAWASPAEVLRVLAGETVPGVSFTVGELRLPRAILGLLAGFAFGAAGATFQTMLRNPLASPDIIGISAGASAAAVFGIVVLSASGLVLSALALAGAILTTLVIALLAQNRGFSTMRLVLIGIGVAALLQSAISYLISKAGEWDLQTAMQWMTGSLNGASWEKILPLVGALLVCAPLLLANGRGLDLLRLGDDAAVALGVRVGRVRILAVIAAVGLLAFATAGSGPIAFVAFMAGPIAARLVGPGSRLTIPAGLVGACLVLGADLIGQNLFDHRYPVGVVTGVLGAPYLVLLLIRMNRSGGSL